MAHPDDLPTPRSTNRVGGEGEEHGQRGIW